MAQEVQTKLKDLIDPEVMGQVVSGALPKKIKFRRFAKIDDTLTNRPGSTVTIPKYGYIGTATDVPEGTPIDIAKLSTSSSQVTVKKAGIGVELTDESVLSGVGDPMGEATNQLTLSIADKVDNDCYDELCTSKFVYVGSDAELGYASVVKANMLFDDESDNNLGKVMWVAPEQAEKLLLDPNFISKDKYDAPVTITGEVGRVAGTRIIKSKKVMKPAYEHDQDGLITVTEPLTKESEGGLSDGTHKRLDEVEGKVLGGNVKVGDKLTAVVQEYWANPIVILDEEDPNTDANADGTSAAAPALTIYMKRDVMVEDGRDIINKTTVITADEHYVASLSNESKVVLAKIKAAGK